MTKGKNTGRKTQRIVRAPATKSAHLRKRMEQRRLGGNKMPRGRGY
jgi:hypothetical protein